MIKESKIHKQILKLDPLVIAQEFTRIVSLLHYQTWCGISYAVVCENFDMKKNLSEARCDEN